MDTKYNGWANYETWCIALWLNNEETSYRYWRDAAQQAAKESPEASQVKEGLWSANDAATNLLADQLHEQVHDSERLKDSDLLHGHVALSRVGRRRMATKSPPTFWKDFLPRRPTDAPPRNSRAYPATFSARQNRFDPWRSERHLPKGPFVRPWSDMYAAIGGWWPPKMPKKTKSRSAEGFRLLSVYEDSEGTRFWVITEADRSSTTILLPSEY